MTVFKGISAIASEIETLLEDEAASDSDRAESFIRVVSFMEAVNEADGILGDVASQVKERAYVVTEHFGESRDAYLEKIMKQSRRTLKA